MSRHLRSEERRSYEIVRAEAQARANEIGVDFGVEFNGLVKEWNFFMLPQLQNRHGFELRCEIVTPMKVRT